MKRITLTLLIPLLVLTSQSLFAQNERITKHNDSSNTVILKDYQLKLAEIEKQHIADSLQKLKLEAQINALKTTDNLKKEELQKKIQELNSKEEKRLAQKKARIDSLRHTAQNFPVYGFFNDTLFNIYSNLGSFSARERAEAVSERIKKTANDFKFNRDSLVISQSESTVEINFGETILMSVSENDALWNNSTKLELAKKYQDIISNAILEYKSETSFTTLIKEIGLSLLVLSVLGAIIHYFKKLFKWTAIKIQQHENNRIKGIKIRDYTLFNAKQQVNALLSLNNVLKWLFILLAVYITLPILFGIFPWTKNFTTTLFGYVLNPLKKIVLAFWSYLPNLITIIVIIIVFRYILRGINFLKIEIQRGNLKISGFYPDWANPTYQIVRILVLAFMVIVIFPYLPGSDSPIFRGVSVFLGFLFTFGSAGSLSNIIAGLVLTYMRLFKIGDRVKIGEEVGDVIEKSMLVTRIRTIKNEIISIPNSTVMNSHTINYSSDAPDKGLILHTTVTIGYDVPWRNMHKALIDAAIKTEHILPDPAPFVLQTSLDDFYVSYQINAYTKEPNKQAFIYSNLHQNIQDCCNEVGIEILSPHYRAARDGNMTTIPSNYLDKNYKAPVFTVRNVNTKE
ncbi:mechanosensitive ion channel domain-containing protein [Solitalea koreensis]|uniref:Small-conductance mechanosensitive channel n=1 Tax=Solitalea koreensis TaxID=543615 RepID=A0A521BRX7_9SPHI|nr:mechanosensitive ion channel domain-containing protein [Solitalea koreensis]SMO49481.1 Small-conductance mechanosensitive channel [Solitalea koreensis]